MQRGNFFTNIPVMESGETIEVLSRMTGGNIRIERIVTKNQNGPGEWYDQSWAEWVMVVKGGAELEFASPPAEERLAAGEWLLIPANRRHRVRSCEPGTLWLAVHADVKGEKQE